MFDEIIQVIIENEIIVKQIAALIFMTGVVGYSLRSFKKFFDGICEVFDFSKKNLEQTSKDWETKYKEYTELPIVNKKVIKTRLKIRISIYKFFLPASGGALIFSNGLSVWNTAVEYAEVNSWLTVDIFLFFLTYVLCGIGKIIINDMTFFYLIKSEDE